MRLAAHRVAFDSIPIIDFGSAYSCDLQQRKALGAEIRRASIEIGFFYIKNHGVPEGLIERTFAASRAFFALPLAEKMRLHIAKQSHYSGYIPIAGEKLQDRDSTVSADQKESLELSLGILGPKSGAFGCSAQDHPVARGGDLRERLGMGHGSKGWSRR